MRACPWLSVCISYTCSPDFMQIYELGCGVRICQIIFESSLLAIALDVAEMFLFGAEEKGHLIRKVNFYNTVSVQVAWTSFQLCTRKFLLSVATVF